jgi:hypothetical protein
MRLVLVLILLLTSAELATAECGDHGDPGYRGPDGICVEWCQLERRCGSGVRGKCVPERVSPIIVALQSITPGDPSLPPCRGCGCKRGPGYRAPNGRCVAWKELAKVCGSPPTTRCTAELIAVTADETAAAQAEYAARMSACR